MYVRNKHKQMKECATAFGNPFKKWNRLTGHDFRIRPEREHFLIEDWADPDAPVLRGYGADMATFGDMRGVDLSDVNFVLYDEFIEKDTLLFNQYDAFSNFYETVNRNRELEGEPPLMVHLLSNAQKLDNAILAGYGIIPIIEQLISKGKHTYTNDKFLVELVDSEVSEAKKGTFLYKATEGTTYYQEAIGNEFANDSFYGIGKKPLAEYTPICRIDDMYIWQHKSNGTYYVCRSASNKVTEYNRKDTLAPFLRRYGTALRLAQADGRLTWSEFTIKSKLNNILK